MKKIFYIVILIISLVIINRVVHSIYNLSQKKNVITQTQQELSEEQVKYDRLKDQLARVTRQDYVEEEARNKLFLVQDGENIIVLPSPTKAAGASAEEKSSQQQPVWEQWWRVFFAS